MGHLPLGKLLFRAPSSRALVCYAAAFLTACGGSSGDTPATPSFELPADTISRIGYIWFSSANGEAADLLKASSGITEAYAEFSDFGQVMSQAYIDKQTLTFVGDQCEITIDSSDDSQDVGVDDSNAFTEYESNYRNVNAGDALGISAPSGTWAEMQMIEDIGFGYQFENDVYSLGDIPIGSTISIPGADFPAFEAVDIPHVDRITEATVSNLNKGLLTTDTQFNWSTPTQAHPNSFTYLSIDTDYYDSESNTATYIYVACQFADDGEYSFPVNVKQLISEYQFELEDVYFGRAAINNEIRGNAAVQVININRFIFSL